MLEILKKLMNEAYLYDKYYLSAHSVISFELFKLS